MSRARENQAQTIRRLRLEGYLVERVVLPDGAPEKQRYRPYVNSWSIFSPWADDPLIREALAGLKRLGAKTLVSVDRLYVLKTLAEQCLSLGGEFWEAGVYQGGTALLLKMTLKRHAGAPPALRLFDTFKGMPETRRDLDMHKKGDFGDSSLEFVRSVVGEEDFLDYRPGVVPETFKGLEKARLSFVHVDLDIHDAVRSTCEFAFPRLLPGGVMVFDDYGYHTCPGARMAVDQYFTDRPEVPLCLPTGQALVTKLP